MNREQIEGFTREAGGFDATPEFLERFAKLVEQHVLIEWANEFAGLGEWACVHRIENELK